MIRIDRNIGARVVVKEVLTTINPEVKWKKIKKVPGVIVENKGYEQYYHTCSGYTCVTKHLIENDYVKTYAIKLDNNIKDIEGNNIVVVREFKIKFLDRINTPSKSVSEQSYQNALKTIARYNSENNIKTK